MADYSGVVPGSKIKNTPTLYIAWFLCVGRQNLYYKKLNVCLVYSVK